MDIQLCSETNKRGGVLNEIWHLWPLNIGGVSDKHPHDSDHAECTNISIDALTVSPSIKTQHWQRLITLLHGRHYSKRAVQPICALQNANCAVQNWKLCSYTSMNYYEKLRNVRPITLRLIWIQYSSCTKAAITVLKFPSLLSRCKKRFKKCTWKLNIMYCYSIRPTWKNFCMIFVHY